ncbi:hypothetical protein [Cytobacillus gottheilii]|uniref:Uncharacterized protein n=1 Tax=Cytobacillus gottheilii TaxID=859144 RepID=A0ABX8F9V8_9BACI|nr:hypothetical protein [Cytobacillus gottheilii]QVY60949.1 hypothetical protein J1899_18560 [Cytobacillus gottheilii]
MEEFLVKAIKTDSWLGIVQGETYTAKVFKGSYGEKTMVYTNGYCVAFHDKDFKKVK